MLVDPPICRYGRIAAHDRDFLTSLLRQSHLRWEGEPHHSKLSLEVSQHLHGGDGVCLQLGLRLRLHGPLYYGTAGHTLQHDPGFYRVENSRALVSCGVEAEEPGTGR